MHVSAVEEPPYLSKNRRQLAVEKHLSGVSVPQKREHVSLHFNFCSTALQACVPISVAMVRGCKKGGSCFKFCTRFLLSHFATGFLITVPVFY